MEKKPNMTKIIIAVLIVIALIIVGIILITKAGNNNQGEQTGAIKTESEFENIQAKDIEITYKEETDITAVSLVLENFSDEDINKQTVNIMLLDSNDTQITGIQNYVSFIAAKGTIEVYAETKGNYSQTTKIQLQKPITAQK